MEKSWISLLPFANPIGLCRPQAAEFKITNVKEETLNVRIANAKRQNGLVTSGDVYKTQAKLAEAELNWRKARGDLINAAS